MTPASLTVAAQGVAGFGDLPAPSLMYLGLYLGTLCLHAVLAGYVLAGSGYIAAATVFGGQSSEDPLKRVLVDWLPFSLGVAITMGVAPLLFIQILYKENFYTANLLLFHHWMIMVPVLIVGFYLLYLNKTERVASWGRGARSLVALGAFVCFGFAAWSWTGNHLIALERARWAALYAAGGVPAPTLAMLLRLGLWLGGSLPVMAAIAGWQLARAQPGAKHQPANDDAGPLSATVTRARARLAILALAGIGAAAAAAIAYTGQLAESARAALAQTPSALGVAALGTLMQIAAWIWLLRGSARARVSWSRPALAAVALGTALTVLGVAAARELVRMAHIDTGALLETHARVAEAGGIVAFFVFLLLNGGLIAWTLVALRRALRSRAVADANADANRGADAAQTP